MTYQSEFCIGSVPFRVELYSESLCRIITLDRVSPIQVVLFAHKATNSHLIHTEECDSIILLFNFQEGKQYFENCTVLSEPCVPLLAD